MKMWHDVFEQAVSHTHTEWISSVHAPRNAIFVTYRVRLLRYIKKSLIHICWQRCTQNNLQDNFIVIVYILYKRKIQDTKTKQKNHSLDIPVVLQLYSQSCNGDTFRHRATFSWQSCIYCSLPCWTPPADQHTHGETRRLSAAKQIQKWKICFTVNMQSEEHQSKGGLQN